MKVQYIDFGGKIPERAHYNDAGLDCFSNESFVIAAHSIAKVKLGFGIALPDGFVAFLAPRSSMNAKGIICELGTIDAGYRGEISAVISNETNDNLLIGYGLKIAQLVVLPCIYVELAKSLANDRGEGGFGSTGAK